ncbi:hypothetical protein MMC18_007001 [Xylographa bjoerkii]|nr:hypothetical protein [Xylographa bjoerkii]
MPALGTDRERFPELFDQTSINPRSRTRKVEMQVLVIGMMRTGTKSTKAALEQLGYNDVYHMVTAMKNPKDYDMWAEAFNAKFHGKGKMFGRKEWDQLLGDCAACIDVPTAAFMPELIAAYPDAKVIISMRDPDKWYTSFMATVGKHKATLRAILLGLFDPFFFGKFGPCVGSMMEGMFGKDIEDADYVKKRYLEFHEEVRQLVPEHKRLEYHLGDGWEPLCKFLGKDIPKNEFPFINESKEFGERITLLERQGLGRAIRNGALIAGALTLASTFYFGLLPRW